MMNPKVSDERVGNKNGRVTIFVSALLLLTILLVAANNLAVNNVAAQTSPPLGAAAAYSILGNSGVTCTGASHVSGDVGSYPTTSDSGFPSPCSVGPPGSVDQIDMRQRLMLRLLLHITLSPRLAITPTDLVRI